MATTAQIEAECTMNDAIALSIAEDRTVTIGFDDNGRGRVEDVFMGNADVDGDAESGSEHEFWGTTDGCEWRVHVITEDVD